MWSLRINPQAKKFLDKLEKEDYKRIIKKFKEIETNPFRFLQHYEGNYYKLRIGNFRVLLDMDFKYKLILIQIIDKRGRIYKR